MCRFLYGYVRKYERKYQYEYLVKVVNDLLRK